MRVKLYIFRSLRHLLYTIVLLVTGSALLTYNFCRFLPMRQDKKISSKRTVHLNQEKSTLFYRLSASGYEEAVVKQALEGVLYEEGRLNGDYLKEINRFNSSESQFERVKSSVIQPEDQYEAHAESATVFCRGHLCRSNNLTLTSDWSISESYSANDSQGDALCEIPCNNELMSLPYLRCVRMEPPLALSPELNTSITADYYATVPYHVLLVRVHALALNCLVDVRLSNKHGPTSTANFTLGLGLNRIHLLLVYNRRADSAAAPDPCGGAGTQCVVSTYTLHLYRQHAGEVRRDASGARHQVCHLLQDCGLRYLPSESCGLQPSNYLTWENYKLHRWRLKPCVKGTEPGRWLVPCMRCAALATCRWAEAVWQPYTCVHSPLGRSQLRTCLAGKKILFIGDSTNRGIMHYLMEHANGSLTEWDKTHDSKVYSNINDQSTTVSFAYYPQFWLSARERPLFDETLFQLLKMTQPLENSDSTVLVVGGVHWLAIQHLNVIAKVLKREGLSNIRVIVKTLGAGFHQPVDGLHHLTMADQRRLVVHNAVLVDHASSLGFDVVETFNMTMARYADFLQGKCACHFHRVKEVLPSFTQYALSSRRSSSGGGRGESASPLTDMPIHFHVEGDINAVYSEIVFNRICSGREGG